MQRCKHSQMTMKTWVMGWWRTSFSWSSWFVIVFLCFFDFFEAHFDLELRFVRAFLGSSRQRFLDGDPVDVGGSKAACHALVGEESSLCSGGAVIVMEPNMLQNAE